MRNGDFVPTRLQAQQDAVNLVCLSKTRSNPENNVGLLTLAKYVTIHLYLLYTLCYEYLQKKKMCISAFSVRVLATLTADVGRILSKLHQVQPNGNINFSTGIRIAHVIYNYIYYFIYYAIEIKIFVLFINVITVSIETPSRKKSQNAYCSICGQSCRFRRERNSQIS